MNLDDVIFIDSFPTLDLHGFDRNYASLKINEFINDNKKMGNNIIVIIHGIGNGSLKNETYLTLKKNKNVLDYKLFYRNVGVTIAKINV